MHIAGRNHLFVPGPSNVPDRILRAMVVAQEDHRSARFPELTNGILADIKKVFKTTEGQVFVFPASGTAMWEAALTNTLSPGDKVLASRFGQFSHLWIDMAQRLGFDVQVIEAEWGTGVPIDQYEEVLRGDKAHKIKAVLACHNETATGVTSDIAGLRKAMNAAGHPALLLVDTVSSLVSIDFRMDEWGVDCTVSGSQKGFMLPAGLGMLGVSQKALKAMTTATSRRCYFDLLDMQKANATGYFPYTPSIPLLYGMRESLNVIFEEGLENIFCAPHLPGAGRSRGGHRRLGPEALRQGAEVVFRHGERHPRSRGRRCREGDQPRLQALQPVAGSRPVQGGGQGVPYRPPR